MTDEEVDEIFRGYKTLCCNTDYKKESKLKYTCVDCGEDITMHLLYLHMALTKTDDEKKLL